jgi:prolyl-tRNA synthetase
VQIVSIGKSGSEELAKAEEIGAALDADGLAVLLDDRDASPGEKFADADLLGVPVRLTVGRKGLERGVVELKTRDGESVDVALEDVASSVADIRREQL